MDTNVSTAALDFQTLHEVVRAARARLSDHLWGYVVGGADTETTVARNRQALDSVALRPRVLRDVRSIDTGRDFLGRAMRMPVMLAPIGGLEQLEAGGAATVVRAAAAFGVPAMVSSVTHPNLEGTAEAAPDGFRMYQLYVRGDQAWMDDQAERAIAAGYHAFCFTVDTAVYSRRERDIAGRFSKPWRRGATASGMDFQAGLNWEHVRRFKDQYRIPLIIKGIATAEDAIIACDHGVEVVYVSNHGGRQLDHGRGTLDVLPEVLEAVRGRAKVIIDGGFMRGTDVVKAIALGADLVGIGRLYGLGMSAAGEAGILRVLELLEEEIRGTMGLLGATKMDALNGSFLHRAMPVGLPHVLSAFPLLHPSEVPPTMGPAGDRPPSEG
ncbi:alpha-hydroxy acid oxidase [Muricoccus radiodurans]|uniref:alpha-hydroxy acid oxidase n=1 Tax=Muricoccus radiodurans TaxID=2231721 RepID=UPI003CEF92E6